MGVSCTQMLPSPGAKTNLPLTPAGRTGELPVGMGVMGDGGIDVGTGPEGIGIGITVGREGIGVGVVGVAQATDDKSKMKVAAKILGRMSLFPFMTNRASTSP